tara:strand:- start:6534 stop:6863 length:330 start_codon:yes stop_codon:yes gene_type:complete
MERKMHEHLKTLSARHLATIATRLAIVAFSLRVAWLLVLNMGVTLAIFGPVLTVIVLSVLGMVLWFSVERIGDILDPRCVSPQGDGDQETTPNLSPRVRHLKGDAYRAD